MDIANNKPVRKRAKRAKISPELRAQNKEAADSTVHSSNADMLVAINKLDEVVEALAVKHGKPVDVVQELLHLGGHVLKSHPAVGINNAYAHCEARYDTTCTCSAM
jgi:hypothetical protein